MTIYTTPRPGFGRADLLVLTLLSALLCPLVVTATLKAKENADKTTCTNNLKGIILAALNCHDTYGKFPPLVGTFPNEMSQGTVFFHLLPFVDQDKLYKLGEGEKDHFSVWNNDVFSKGVELYQCPADTSSGKDKQYEGWLGLSNYGANYLVFGEPVNNTMQGKSRIASIADGLANTIFFAERYQMCNGTPMGWGYAGESLQAPAFGYLSLGLFQDRPAQKDCDPTRTQAIHPGGILVALGDGSVRSVGLHVCHDTWWKAIVPDDGLPMGLDW